MTSDPHPPTVGLVVGGRWHDMRYARQQLLDHLDELGIPSPMVAETYADIISGAPDLLISYTCDVRPAPATQAALSDRVAGGGRWLALHATNAALDPPHVTGTGRFRAVPDVLGEVTSVLGSRFLGHPPVAPYTVQVTDAVHPLTRGLDPFEVRDELYVSELATDIEVLLHAEFGGSCPGFEDADADPDDPLQPVLYLRRHGDGQVCYFTLGHCRDRGDLRDLGIEDTGEVDRGSWEDPTFGELLSRALRLGLTPPGWDG